MPKTKRDYYTVYVPDDITDPTDRVLIALTEAENATRLFCIPCKWDILSDDGQNVVVRRTRLVHEQGYKEQGQ